MGPKPYMEDEYICVDNLSEHLGSLIVSLHLEHFMGTMTIANLWGFSSRAWQKRKSNRIVERSQAQLYIRKTQNRKVRGCYLRWLSQRPTLGHVLLAIAYEGSQRFKMPLKLVTRARRIGLNQEDEFLIIGCDGLWDVMSSQYAVTIVTQGAHDAHDPHTCSRVLVVEALKRNTCDNLTVVVVHFSRASPRIEIPKSHKRRSISAEGLDLLKGVLSNA
ncbi:hypothetical protein DH2020_040355 [Rehmannia glutinosa]|uniref:PPM-type phosphatase domain-containing protein n=1 Tax=Rehmannia glutinosa TaxID=99300 RepID=A0ABR0UV90_REHGL